MIMNGLMKNKVNKIFSVYIHDKEYDVYSLEGREHEGYNNMPTTWWLYFSDKLPEGVLPPLDSEYFKPFDVGINRRLWDIRIKQHNTHKVKWNEDRFDNKTIVEMWCNKKLIYKFSTWKLDFAMAKIQYLQVVLSEHAFNFFNPEEENGRKICWYGLPATIIVKSRTWEIEIVPEYDDIYPKEKWWNELKKRSTNYSKESLDDIQWDEEHFNESKEYGTINWGDALSDGHIYWFRK